MTKGYYILDDPAGGQIVAGLILLLFAICMLGMSAYKTYRFCKKYTFQEYHRKKRMQKYLN